MAVADAVAVVVVVVVVFVVNTFMFSAMNWYWRRASHLIRSAILKQVWSTLSSLSPVPYPSPNLGVLINHEGNENFTKQKV